LSPSNLSWRSTKIGQTGLDFGRSLLEELGRIAWRLLPEPEREAAIPERPEALIPYR